MLTRMRWFTAGVSVGVATTFYGLFRLRQTRSVAVDPGELVDVVGTAMRRVGLTARDAWDESREAIAEAEGELRAGYVQARPHLREGRT